MAFNATLTNCTSAFELFETTYSFLPPLMMIASRVGMQIGAPSPISPPGDCEVSGADRHFTHLESGIDSIKSLPSPAVALAGDLVCRPGSFYIAFYDR